MFGELPSDPKEKPIRLAVPTRPLNVVEHALTCAMREEMMVKCDVPIPFLEDGKIANDSDYVQTFGRPLSLAEVDAIGEMIAEPIADKYHKQICTARELGPDGTLADYLLACELQQIDSLVEKIK